MEAMRAGKNRLREARIEEARTRIGKARAR
jgi:hypothetical protein